jgi:hypothetical protein
MVRTNPVYELAKAFSSVFGRRIVLFVIIANVFKSFVRLLFVKRLVDLPPKKWTGLSCF